MASMGDVNSSGVGSGTQISVRLEIEKKVVNSIYIDLEMLGFIYRLSQQLEVFQNFPSVWREHRLPPCFVPW